MTERVGRVMDGLPPERPLIAPLRPLDSAETSLRRLPDGRLLMTIRRLFGERHGRAWLKHNVEEVGLFEYLLPDLHARRGE